jgi:hypothetical protein
MNHPNNLPEKKTTVDITGMSAKIKEIVYTTVPDSTLTLCLLYMKNGYVVIGKSACVDASKFNVHLGEKYAYEDALNALWSLEGYLMAERLMESKDAS